MAFHAAREIIDGIAWRNPVYGDVRDLGEFADLLEVLWWVSDNGDNAGQQMIARGRRGADPEGDPVTLRYRRLCPLWHLRREDDGNGEDPAAPFLDPYDRSMDAGPPPDDSPFVYSGARILVDGTFIAPLNKTAEEIVISRVARPPDGSPAVGNAADVLRAYSVFDSEPSPTSPFDWPAGKTILYAVTHGTGRWRYASNVVVRFGPSAGSNAPPREVLIIRGSRPYHHAHPLAFVPPPAVRPPPPTM
jgi:hypothetical protein